MPRRLRKGWAYDGRRSQAIRGTDGAIGRGLQRARERGPRRGLLARAGRVPPAGNRGRCVDRAAGVPVFPEAGGDSAGGAPGRLSGLRPDACGPSDLGRARAGGDRSAASAPAATAATHVCGPRSRLVAPLLGGGRRTDGALATPPRGQRRRGGLSARQRLAAGGLGRAPSPAAVAGPGRAPRALLRAVRAVVAPCARVPAAGAPCVGSWVSIRASSAASPSSTSTRTGKPLPPSCTAR